MYEKFTDRARKVNQLAVQEAAWLGDSYVGTEHILLGLIREGSGVGCAALKNLGVSFDDVVAETRNLLGKAAAEILNKAKETVVEGFKFEIGDTVLHRTGSPFNPESVKYLVLVQEATFDANGRDNSYWCRPVLPDGSCGTALVRLFEMELTAAAKDA